MREKFEAWQPPLKRKCLEKLAKEGVNIQGNWNPLEAKEEKNLSVFLENLRHIIGHLQGIYWNGIACQRDVGSQSKRSHANRHGGWFLQSLCGVLI
jgi:hypothetical protein